LSRGKIALIVIAAAVPTLALCAIGWAGILAGLRASEDATTPASPTVSASPTVDVRAVPEVGACYEAMTTGLAWNDRAERDVLVDCEAPHQMETVASGSLRTRPTSPKDPQAGEVYGSCETAADQFLGQPWGTTYTFLVLSVPGLDAWGRGARWYRCDLMRAHAMGEPGGGQATTGSLRTTAEPITCLNWTVNADATGISDIVPGQCTAPHNGEFAGVVAMPGFLDRSDNEAVSDRLDELCRPVVLGFLGRNSVPSALDVWFNWPLDTRADGQLDQNVRCMIAAADLNRRFTASLKGIGSAAIPFAG